MNMQTLVLSSINCTMTWDDDGDDQAVYFDGVAFDVVSVTRFDNISKEDSALVHESVLIDIDGLIAMQGFLNND